MAAMQLQLRANVFNPETKTMLFSRRPLLTSLHSSVSISPSVVKLKSQLFERKRKEGVVYGGRRRRRRENGVVLASSNVATWESWKPEKASASPSLSDVLWPAAGAFAAMAIFGKMDQILAPKGFSMTIAPFGAVCAVLFTTPSAPSARKYNMFMSQIGCAAIGVLALSLFGPGWLCRSAALAASIAFMVFTRSNHPPAASLPLLFIDAAKLHHLSFWYALFPGAAGCLLLCILQEMVSYLKDNVIF